MTYSEEILDLYSEKPNYGNLDGKTHEAEHENPICGDHINVELKMDGDIVSDIAYTNKKGCFVTILSASVLTEKIKGMHKDDILKMTKKDIDLLLGKEVIETRIKCELLPLEAIKKALSQDGDIRD